MRKCLQLGWVMVLGASCLHAAEIANLRNGFSIRHERHESQGEITRLYLGSDAASSYVDVATSQIESFEPAPTEIVSPGTGGASPDDLQTIIGQASERSRIDADFIA